eukprot:m.158244 g.158244  ORF g.158244 m.158244 type:complete len:235 (+) comp15131_c1_seq5:123-827(+)
MLTYLFSAAFAACLLTPVDAGSRSISCSTYYLRCPVLQEVGSQCDTCSELALYIIAHGGNEDDVIDGCCEPDGSAYAGLIIGILLCCCCCAAGFFYFQKQHNDAHRPQAQGGPVHAAPVAYPTNTGHVQGGPDTMPMQQQQAPPQQAPPAYDPSMAPQQPNYAPGQYPPQQGQYPPQGYAPQPQAYPPQQGQGYPPQQAQGYPPQQAQGYPPQGQPYPPQQGYPPQPYDADSKA